MRKDCKKDQETWRKKWEGRKKSKDKEQKKRRKRTKKKKKKKGNRARFQETDKDRNKARTEGHINGEEKRQESEGNKPYEDDQTEMKKDKEGIMKGKGIWSKCWRIWNKGRK